MLAGEEQLVDEAREWRHRHGGMMYAMWPYAASGLVGLRRRAPLMPRYVEHAKAVCAELAEVEGVTVVPDPPVTNMAHLYLPTDKETLIAATRALAVEEKVWTWSHAAPSVLPDQAALELTVGDATLGWSPGEVRDIIVRLLEPRGSRSR